MRISDWCSDVCSSDLVLQLQCGTANVSTIVDGVMVAQHRRQFPDRLAAIGGDIAHHAFITPTIIADVDACDTMLPQDRQERALAARFDTPDGGAMLCALGLDPSLNGGLVGGKLRARREGG